MNQLGHLIVNRAELERFVVAPDREDAERLLALHDQLLGHSLARLHHAHEQRGGADCDGRLDATLDQHRNSRGSGIVGHQHQMVFDVSDRRFPVETDQQIVADLTAATARFDHFGRNMGIGTLHAHDLPGAAAVILDRNLPSDRLAVVDRSQLNAAGVDRDIVADVAFDVQLDLAIEGLIEGHGERGAPVSAERTRVELGDNGPFFVRLQQVILDGRDRAAATRPDARDVNVFQVDVLQDELVFDLGILGHGAEVVAELLEHLLGPLLPEGGRNDQQTYDHGK